MKVVLVNIICWHHFAFNSFNCQSVHWSSIESHRSKQKYFCCLRFMYHFFYAYSDINECNIGIDNCDEHAICINTPGSYHCSCTFGYTGSGIVGYCKGMIWLILNELLYSFVHVCSSLAGYVRVRRNSFIAFLVILFSRITSINCTSRFFIILYHVDVVVQWDSVVVRNEIIVFWGMLLKSVDPRPYVDGVIGSWYKETS